MRVSLIAGATTAKSWQVETFTVDLASAGGGDSGGSEGSSRDVNKCSSYQAVALPPMGGEGPSVLITCSTAAGYENDWHAVRAMVPREPSTAIATVAPVAWATAAKIATSSQLRVLGVDAGTIFLAAQPRTYAPVGDPGARRPAQLIALDAATGSAPRDGTIEIGVWGVIGTTAAADPGGGGITVAVAHAVNAAKPEQLLGDVAVPARAYICSAPGPCKRVPAAADLALAACSGFDISSWRPSSTEGCVEFAGRACSGQGDCLKCSATGAAGTEVHFAQCACHGNNRGVDCSECETETSQPEPGGRCRSNLEGALKFAVLIIVLLIAIPITCIAACVAACIAACVIRNRRKAAAANMVQYQHLDVQLENIPLNAQHPI
jgi:hypothetical protein